MPGRIINNQNFDAKKDIQAENYRVKESTSQYDRSTGILVLPIAGPEGTPPLVIKVHASYGLRKENFGYGKINTPPIIPSPEDRTASGDILLSANLRFMQPQIRDQQNQLEFAVTGEYLYVQSSVRGVGSTYPTQEYVHITPQMNDQFDQEDKGFYSAPSFLNIAVGGVVGGAFGAIKATIPLTNEAVISNLSDKSNNPNAFFTVQSATYFPVFFKPDAIV